jgi:hypothetical protein
MPRSMLRLAACLLVCAASVGLLSCNDKEPGIDEPAREGLAIGLDGIDYTVFITRELNPKITPDNAYVTDDPEPLPADNQFAYTPITLDPEECIPEAGSVAQLGPTAGSMLLFKFPLENTENRPLELEIEQNGEKRTFELDI